MAMAVPGAGFCNGSSPSSFGIGGVIVSAVAFLVVHDMFTMPPADTVNVVVAFSAPVSMLPVGSGPVASVVEPLLSVMEVALTTFQLSVTFDPGVTVLELAVKLEMVGG